MSGEMKSACFDEITHSICDADKKVTISDVSNNWNISHRDSETILLEWIEKNKNEALSKEFLIRGVDKDGNCVITVLAENKLDVVQKKFQKFCYSLYSIELASRSNTKRINVPKISDCKWINLPLKHIERDMFAKPIQPIKHAEEPTSSKKSIQSMFSAKEPTTKKEVKQETQNVDMKTEKKSPKQSPKPQSPKKTVKTPKMASSKASISSFFSKPSSQVVGESKKKEVDLPVKKEEKNSSDMFDDQSSMDVDDSEQSSTAVKVETQAKKPASTKKNNKRPIKDVHDDGSDDIPGTPQDNKKIKKMNKKTSEKSKHTRIVKMLDSSDDDDNHDAQLVSIASPVKEKENKTPPKKEKATDNNIRRKGKKTVSRTFKDEEGYLVTKNEVVEYSCSEEESESVSVAPVKGIQPAGLVAATEGSQKNKKKSPPNANTKQGSILSFFSKK